MSERSNFGTNGAVRTRTYGSTVTTVSSPGTDQEAGINEMTFRGTRSNEFETNSCGSEHKL